VNEIERKMVQILSRGKDEFGVVSVKAEFEAEGTRLEELLRLVDVARAAGLAITVKIGGCEAIRDLLEAKQIGVQFIVAPMIESQYALSKFTHAKNLIYSIDDQRDTEFLFNMETITSFNNREKLFDELIKHDGPNGIVFGRVDFVGSMGWPREAINLQKTTEYIVEIAKLCKNHNKHLVMGGGVSIESIEAIKKVHETRLDRFETRKVVFGAEIALQSDIEMGLLDAVEFELLWLINKQNYYSGIAAEDSSRIQMLKLRHQELSEWKSRRS